MSDSALDQIVDDLRSSGSKYFPQHSEAKTARVVGHTPKPDHYTYEIVLDFPDGSERVNAKIYRGRSGGRTPQESALRESQRLHFAHETAQRRHRAAIRRSPGAAMAAFLPRCTTSRTPRPSVSAIRQPRR